MRRPKGVSSPPANFAVVDTAVSVRESLLVHPELRQQVTYLSRQFWVGYPAAERALRRLEFMWLHSRTHRMPGVLIFGATNNGKTHVIQRFIQLVTRTLPPAALGDDRTPQLRPVLHVIAPPVPEEGRLYRGILDDLEVAAPVRLRTTELLNLAVRILRERGVRLLVVDEIQHLLAVSVRAQRQVANSLKQLSITLQMPIAVVGTGEAKAALSVDPQLTSRFVPFELPLWSLDDEYRRLIASFAKQLSMINGGNLIEPDVATKLYELAGPTIGGLAELLRLAAIYQALWGASMIDIGLLDRLVRAGVWVKPRY